MRQKIDFGRIKISAEDYAISGNAVLGIKDSGKSQTAKFIAEKLMDSNIPIIAIDNSGVWPWLKVGRTRGSGYPVVVAGGERKDFPITAKTAPEIIRAARKARISLVIDLFDRDLSDAECSRIVAEICRILHFENKQWGLCHVFFEEAQQWVPQIIRAGYGNEERGKAYSAIEKFCQIGGNSGAGYTLISQRAEGVNKAVLELCDHLILGRQKGKNSLIALGKWLDAVEVKNSRELKRQIPRLSTGEFLVWPSASDEPIKVHVPQNRTFHPNRRHLLGRGGQEKYKPVDTKFFVAEMGKTLQTIVEQSKENDPVELRKQIARLNKELSVRQKETKMITERIPVFRDGEVAKLEKLVAQLSEISDKEYSVAHSMTELGAEMEETVRDVLKSTKADMKKQEWRPAQSREKTFMRQSETKHDRSEQRIKLRAGEYIMLRCLAQAGEEGLNDAQWRTVSHVNKPSTFKTYKTSLRRKELAGGNGTNIITEIGKKHVGDDVPDRPLMTEEIMAHWKKHLRAGEYEMLSGLVSIHPNEVSINVFINDRFQESTVRTYAGKLKRIGLADIDGEMIRASNTLFPQSQDS